MAVKRVYPHVDGVEDWRAQQTARLLWDRVHDLAEQLQASQTRIEELTVLHQENADAIAQTQATARQAARAINNLNTAVAAGPTLPPTAPNGMAILNSVLAAGGPGGPWDLASPDTTPVQTNPLGQGAFIDAAVPALHASDPNWGQINKVPGQTQSPAPTAHAVDAIIYKNVDGVTAEIYDVITSWGTLQWSFADRTAANLPKWRYP